jgi:hypothetical protein
MKKHLLRVRSVLAVGCLALLLLAATATGARPRAGDFKWCNYNSEGKFCQDTVTFEVPNSRDRIKQLFVATYSCGAGYARPANPIRVSDQGRFSFNGLLKGVGSPKQARITGRFVSKRKATGTVRLPECGSGTVGTYNFIATRRG